MHEGFNDIVKSSNFKSISMQKIYLLFLMLLLGMNNIHAQSIERSVIGVSGTSSETATLHLDWTLGELAVNTLQYSKGQITEGFHQSNLIVHDDFRLNRPDNTIESKIDIAIRPNPVKDFLNIQINSDFEEQGILQLMNASGQNLHRLSIDLQHYQNELDLSKLAPGLYLLRLSHHNGRLIQTFKIQKIN